MVFSTLNINQKNDTFLNFVSFWSFCVGVGFCLNGSFIRVRFFYQVLSFFFLIILISQFIFTAQPLASLSI